MIKGTRLNTLGNSGTHHVHSAPISAEDFESVAKPKGQKPQRLSVAARESVADVIVDSLNSCTIRRASVRRAILAAHAGSFRRLSCPLLLLCDLLLLLCGLLLATMANVSAREKVVV